MKLEMRWAVLTLCASLCGGVAAQENPAGPTAVTPLDVLPESIPEADSAPESPVSPATKAPVRSAAPAPRVVPASPLVAVPAPLPPPAPTPTPPLIAAPVVVAPRPVADPALPPTIARPAAPLSAPVQTTPAVSAVRPELPTPPITTDGNGERVVQVLDLPRALEIVWTENPQVQEQLKNIEAAGYDIKGSYGGFLPSVNVTNGTGRNALSSVQASLPLFSGGLTFAQIDASRAREIEARANLDKIRLTLGNDTLTAFYNQAQAQDQLLEWSTYLAALKRLNNTIINRADQGVAPQSDVQTAVSRIRQAEVGREAARFQLLSSRNELAKLLQVTAEAVQWREDAVSSLANIDTASTQALVDQHPDVLIATAQVAVQHATVKEARAQLYPGVALNYTHYYDGIAFDETRDSPQLVVQYQVGNGYAAIQKVHSEKSKEDSARAHRDAVRREVLATLLASRTLLASSSISLDLQKQANDSTQSLVDSFLRQYQVGRRSWVEVLNAQREAHDNSLQLIASRRAYALSAQQLALQSLEWDALLGNKAAESGVRPSDIKEKLKPFRKN